jgi:hypothetical protein
VNTIKVSKAELIETLRLNRDEHQAIFDKAMDVYRDKMIEELEARIVEVKAGSKIRRGFSLPEPENHVVDFDYAIEMLELDLDDEVVLTVAEFRTYYKNEWGWQQSFAGNTQSYLAQ